MLQAAFMLSVALFFEGIQALLLLLAVGAVVNTIIGVAAFLVFFVWFLANGVHFMNSTRALIRSSIMAVGLIAEVTPFINAILPGIFISVLVNIIMVKLADRRYNEKRSMQ